MSGLRLVSDSKVAVDNAATPDYLGNSSSTGVLRTGSTLSYTDGGDYVTLAVDTTATYSWSGTHTFTEDVTFDGATSGRDVVFDRSENRLRVEDNAQVTFGAGGSTPYDAVMYSNGTYLILDLPPVTGITARTYVRSATEPYSGEAVPCWQFENGSAANGIGMMGYQIYAKDPDNTADAWMVVNDSANLEDAYFMVTFSSADDSALIDCSGGDNTGKYILFGVADPDSKIGVRTGISPPSQAMDIGGNVRIRTTSGLLVGGSLSTSDHIGRLRYDGTDVVLESLGGSNKLKLRGGPNTDSNGSGSAVEIYSGASAGNGGSAIIGYAVPTNQGSGTTTRSAVEHFRAADGCFTITHPSQADSVSAKVMRITSAATNDDPVIDIYQARVATTNATLTTLYTLAIPTSTRVHILVEVVARRTGGSSGTTGDGATYVYRATYNNISGTVTLEGSVTTVHTEEDQSGWDCQLNISSTNVLIQVQGAADNNVTWHLSKLEVKQVST